MTMRCVRFGFSMIFGLLSACAVLAQTQFSIGIGMPGLSIGINVPAYPTLVRVPGYPVYYAPQLQSNYFFYDGMYWVYQDDDWYASEWYDGPWGQVSPIEVPVFVLRVPVRYYRSPPVYFSGWRRDAPPRWGDHWGDNWQRQRGGWDRWNRNSAPAPAPLPSYQRQYRGERYPQVEQQRDLRGQNYRYRPRDPVVRQHFEAHAPQRAPTARPVPDARRVEAPHMQAPVRVAPPAREAREPRHQGQPTAAPREPRNEQRREPPRREAREPAQAPPSPAARRPEPAREGAAPREPRHSQGQGKDERDKGDDRDPGRKK